MPVIQRVSDFHSPKAYFTAGGHNEGLPCAYYSTDVVNEVYSSHSQPLGEVERLCESPPQTQRGMTVGMRQESSYKRWYVSSSSNSKKGLCASGLGDEGECFPELATCQIQGRGTRLPLRVLPGRRVRSLLLLLLFALISPRQGGQKARNERHPRGGPQSSADTRSRAS